MIFWLSSCLCFMYIVVLDLQVFLDFYQVAQLSTSTLLKSTISLRFVYFLLCLLASIEHQTFVNNNFLWLKIGSFTCLAGLLVMFFTDLLCRHLPSATNNILKTLVLRIALLYICEARSHLESSVFFACN